MDQSEPIDVAARLGDWMAAVGPLYQGLALALRDAVAAGDLPRGARLPSERALAQQLALSRGTVVAAYDALRGQGVLESVRGSGTRVSTELPFVTSSRGRRVADGQAAPLFQRLTEGPGATISVASAIDCAPADLRDALIAVARDDLPSLLSDTGYYPSGLPALRVALAASYASAGLPTTAEQILVTTGAHQALSLAAAMYLRPGSCVVTESPAWPGCLDVFRAAGARVVGIPMDDQGLRTDLLAAALTQHRPALVFTMPTVQNPTGVLMSPSRRRRIAELSQEHDIPVLEDSAHTVPGAGEPRPIAGFGGPVISVGSLAKIVWPGLRLGWVRADLATIARLGRYKALADLGTPILDQALAIRLLPDLPDLGHTRARETRRLERLGHVTALLCRYLPEWTWREPDGGSVIWVRLPLQDASAFAQVALRHGVEVIAGSASDPNADHDSFVRLGFGYPLDTLDEMVHRLRQAWTEIGKAD